MSLHGSRFFGPDGPNRPGKPGVLGFKEVARGESALLRANGVKCLRLGGQERMYGSVRVTAHRSRRLAENLYFNPFTQSIENASHFPANSSLFIYCLLFIAVIG